jgi:hypothetical protein
VREREREREGKEGKGGERREITEKRITVTQFYYQVDRMCVTACQSIRSCNDYEVVRY